MHFSQLLTSTAREEHTCLRDGCTVEISAGQHYLGMLVRPKNSKPFIQAFHWHCFLDGILQLEEKRKNSIKIRRAAPRPYRVIRLDPELAAQKKSLVHRLSVVKAQLRLAYGSANEKSIQRNKATLVNLLTKLNEPQFIKPYWWRFGDNLIKILDTGIDPLISGNDARNADHSSNLEAIRLLGQDSEVSKNIKEEVELARTMLVSALKSGKDVPDNILNLAHVLVHPQELFRWGEDLAAEIRRNSKIFDMEEIGKNMETNEQLAEYLRMLAGKLS